MSRRNAVIRITNLHLRACIGCNAEDRAKQQDVS